MAIGIIDYGMGNLKSVHNAFKYVGCKSFISSDVKELAKADRLVLPGVGAFKDAINQLKINKLDVFIKEATDNEIPLLGICLGMQLLFDKSFEYGTFTGLKLIEGEVIPFNKEKLKVPHIGWNSLLIKEQKPLFNDIESNSYVYFVHSYHVLTDSKYVSAETHYGSDIQIAVQYKNIYGVQFHPEKSGETGLKILNNFAIL